MCKRMLVAAVVLLLAAAAPGMDTAIVASPGAGAPGVGATGNGVVLVNIAAANGAGLSHNRHGQFDIGDRGTILNNSQGGASTILGGLVAGNPNLSAGAAAVILNEVASANPSYFNGYLEVAGSRADVIIANPSGINVGGGGFINAGRGILTTGTPRFGQDGGLAGFAMTDGLININGQGLDARQADYAGIYVIPFSFDIDRWKLIMRSAAFLEASQYTTKNGLIYYNILN